MARISRGDWVRRKRDAERRLKVVNKEIQDAEVELRQINIRTVEILKMVGTELRKGRMDHDEFYKLVCSCSLIDAYVGGAR